MRILFICHEYPPKQHGGIGSFTKLMAEQLVLRGHAISVIGYGESLNDSKVIENGVEVLRLIPPRKSKNKYLQVINEFKNRLQFQKAVERQVKNFQAEIVETYEWSGPLLKKPKGISYVVRLHGSNTANNQYMGKKIHPVTRYFERRTILQADFIVAVSNHIANITQTSFHLNFTYHTIYNGVNVHLFQFEPKERNQNQILLVGRMHPHKGFEQLFHALNNVFTQNDELELHIICTVIEDYKLRLLQFVEERFHHRIFFLGRIPHSELSNYYSKANLCILPSLAEAFPLIPLEAMSCGTPVIMSNRFSANEIIEDGVDGFLVNIMNPDELALQITHVLGDQNRIEQMRTKGREKIINFFSVEKIIEANCQFYNSVLINN